MNDRSEISPPISTGIGNWFAASDVGLRRERNEDNWTTVELPCGRGRVFAVCDGMGGHSGGDVASRIAADRIASLGGNDDGERELSEVLVASIRAANREITMRGAVESNLCGMGTTCSVLGITNDAAVIAHVGDSRIYRLREGRLRLLTRDHLWRDENPDADPAASRHILSRCLGMGRGMKIDVGRVSIRPGDAFLLATDGLHGLVDDREIEAVLARHAPRAAVTTLIETALARGGDDNVTVVVVALA